MARLRRIKKSRKLRQLKSSDIKKVRRWLLKKQNGRCAICGENPKRPCLDHEHKKRLKGTGLIRATICSNCNVFLGKAENNCVRYGIGLKELPRRLYQMSKYLRRPHTHLIHPSEAPKPKKLMKRSYNKLHTLYKKNPTRAKFPPFPKSGKMIKGLEKLYSHYELEPEFYGGKK